MIPGIKHYCRISPGKIERNGKVIFQEENSEFSSFMKSLYKSMEIQYRKFFKMDALCKLAFMSAELLLENYALLDKYPSEKIGVVLSNSSSSLDTDRKYQQTLSDIPSPALFVYTLPNISIGEICIRHKFQGENAFFVSEDFDLDRMTFYVNTLLQTTETKACICGWVQLEGSHYESLLYLVEKMEIEKGTIPHESKHLETLYFNT